MPSWYTFPSRRTLIQGSYSGTVLGGTYEITRLLGEGGMGVVYEAVHVRLRQKRFAVKVLRRALRELDDAHQRFQREAQAATEIGHPCIIDVVDYNETEQGYPYFVMEYLEGEDLERRIQRAGPLAPEQALGLMEQACSALQAAHQCGIIHRDIKPENIFLVRDPDERLRIKILDFGLAKITGSALTVAGSVMGTALFMSPEQIRGQPVDHRADIFALGAVLYYVLTAELPFNAQKFPELVQLICDRPTPLLAGRVDGVPRAWDQALARAMAKDRDARYSQAKELAADLAAGMERWRSGKSEREVGPIATADTMVAEVPLDVTLPPSSAPPGFVDPQAASTVRRGPRRGRQLALALVGLCLIGGGGLVVARLNAARNVSSSSRDAGLESAATAPAASADGTSLPVARPPDAGRAELPAAKQLSPNAGVKGPSPDRGRKRAPGPKALEKKTKTVDPDLERDAEEAGQPPSREKPKGQDTLLER